MSWDPTSPHRTWFRRLRPRAGSVVVACGVLLPLTWLLVKLLAESMDWRAVHDTPLLLYMGFLMDRYDFVPHRDFFDMNLVGSYFGYLLIGKLFGYGDAGVRFADLTVMGLIAALTALALRRFGALAAAAAVLLFALRYLLFGPEMTLQRELLMLIPILAGVASATAFPEVSASKRAALAGLFFGAAMTIKPHAPIGLPFVLLYLVFELDRPQESRIDFGRRALRTGLWMGAGLAVPLAAAFAYLLVSGALGAFVDGALNYLPLYGSINGQRVTVQAGERLPYAIRSLAGLNGHWMWVAPAVAGVSAAMANPRLSLPVRRQGGLFAGLILAYAVYPAFSGQFWYYHWLPLVFFLTLGTGLCFAPFDVKGLWPQALTPMVLACVVIFFAFGPQRDFDRLFERAAAPPKGGRADAIGQYLKSHLEPGDTVQPLDWAGTGVVHGMLIAEAKIATRWIYHFHFYHHVSTPYVQRLRQEFMADLTAAQPRFIVEGKVRRPFVRGHDTQERWPAVDQYLREHYRPVSERQGFTIWERDG